MKGIFFLVFSFALLCFIPGKADILVNEQVPYSQLFEIPCTGDSVLLEGSIHFLIQQDVSDQGVIRQRFTINPSGLSGVSEQGVLYHGTGTAVNNIKIDGNQITRNVQYRTLLIGQGPGNDTREIVSFVLNTDDWGDPKAFRFVASDTCGEGG